MVKRKGGGKDGKSVEEGDMDTIGSERLEGWR